MHKYRTKRRAPQWLDLRCSVRLLPAVRRDTSQLHTAQSAQRIAAATCTRWSCTLDGTGAFVCSLQGNASGSLSTCLIHGRISAECDFLDGNDGCELLVSRKVAIDRCKFSKVASQPAAIVLGNCAQVRLSGCSFEDVPGHSVARAIQSFPKCHQWLYTDAVLEPCKSGTGRCGPAGLDVEPGLNVTALPEGTARHWPAGVLDVADMEAWERVRKVRCQLRIMHVLRCTEHSSFR